MTREKAVSITEGTLIPISLLVVIMGGVVWLTNLHAMALENSKRITELVQKQDRYNDTVNQIDMRLNRIEGKLGVK